MGYLKQLSNNPLALLLCVIAGSCVGWLLPGFGSYALVLGQVYLALVNMAALPLLVVATFFGLRQTLLLPQPGWRILMILTLGFGIVLVSALLGTVIGIVTGTGLNLDAATQEILGTMVQTAGGEASNTNISLYTAASASQVQEINQWIKVFPDNFFYSLSKGDLFGVLVGALIFGIAFASLLKSQSHAFMGIIEAIYRALEVIISKVNVFIPVLAFGMAAYFTASIDKEILYAMRSFLVSFFIFAIIMAALAIIFIWRRSGVTFDVVISALKSPVLISLTSGSTTATIPDTIEAMSSKLGFSRGIVELVVPTSSVFMRSGAAFYFAMLAIFVAHIYGQSLSTEEFFLICIGASIAAFASVGSNNLAVVGFAGVVLSMLNLPIQAALVLFLAIDLLCEGPRNLLSLLFACVLIGLVSKGLPSERIENTAQNSIESSESVQFVFSKGNVIVIFVCTLFLGGLIMAAGIGIGMRKTGDALSRGHPAKTSQSTENISRYK